MSSLKKIRLLEPSQVSHWQDKKNQKEFLDRVYKTLELRSWRDWYRVSNADILDSGGAQFLQYFRNSLPDAILSAYPEHKFELNLFRNSTSFGYWREPKNQKAFFEDAAKSLGIKRLEDWYNVSGKEIRGLPGAIAVINGHHTSSFVKALINTYPDHPWKIWKFNTVYHDFWKNKANQREFLDDLYKDLQFKNWEDWYQIKSNDITEHGGSGLLNLYQGSHFKAIISVYSEYDWKLWRFSFIPKSLWNDTLFRREIFESLAKELNINNLEDWYNVSRSDIEDVGAKSLILPFNNSLYKALHTVYPEMNWKIWRLERMSSEYWKNEENVKEALDYGFEQLKLRSIEDWNTVTFQQFRSIGLKGLLEYHGGIQNLLEKYFPTHDWKINNRVYPGKGQLNLFKKVQEIFENHSDIQFNYLHPSLRFVDSDKPMQFDIFIPSINLAFEYQGAQHYQNNVLSPDGSVQYRDEEKKEKCKGAGITLIEVPYYWDEHSAQLVATIARIRPDLPLPSFPSSVNPIENYHDRKKRTRRRKLILNDENT